MWTYLKRKVEVVLFWTLAFIWFMSLMIFIIPYICGNELLRLGDKVDNWYYDIYRPL